MHNEQKFHNIKKENANEREDSSAFKKKRGEKRPFYCLSDNSYKQDKHLKSQMRER